MAYGLCVATCIGGESSGAILVAFFSGGIAAVAALGIATEMIPICAALCTPFAK